jgi:hypothetical protein
MTQALTEATLAGMTLEEIQAHARYSEESTNAVVETLFKALLEARAGTGERDAVWNEAVEACAGWHDKQALYFTEQIKILRPQEAIYAAEGLALTHINSAKTLRALLRSPSTEKDDYRSLRSLKDGAAR